MPVPLNDGNDGAAAGREPEEPWLVAGVDMVLVGAPGLDGAGGVDDSDFDGRAEVCAEGLRSGELLREENIEEVQVRLRGSSHT